MLARFGPVDTFNQAREQLWPGALSSFMPMDAYRHGDAYIVEVDVPGVEPSTIDVTTDHHTLTVRARRELERPGGTDLVAAERPTGEFTRSLMLSDNFDVDRIAATWQHGVLTLRVPLSEKATARKIQVTTDNGRQALGNGQKAIDVESSPRAN